VIPLPNTLTHPETTRNPPHCPHAAPTWAGSVRLPLAVHQVEFMYLPSVGEAINATKLSAPASSSRGREVQLRLEPKAHVHSRIRLRKRLTLDAPRLVWGVRSLVLVGLVGGLSSRLGLPLALGGCGCGGRPEGSKLDVRENPGRRRDVEAAKRWMPVPANLSSGFRAVDGKRGSSVGSSGGD
jgi:hypothetical protein